ncbi:MAG TPA: CHAD domain-containing protein [Planctomycetota bacterium]|nr:CHAD domain-containing protein [Planctomycetota bacterium]
MKPRRNLRASRNATLEKLANWLDRELHKVRRKPSNADAIHDARVAARRLLAAGELWAAPVAAWAGVRDRLPRILKRLGRVRNLDIAVELLKKGVPEDQAARKELSRHLRNYRKQARGEMQDWLTKRKIVRIREGMKTVVREVRQKPVLDAPSPSDLAPHFARVMSLITGRAWAPTAEEAHAIRREVRRLRYAHETLEWAYKPEDFQRVVKALLKIQELAGAWQDRCIIEKLASKAIRRGKVSLPLTGFLSRIQAESKSLSDRFVRAATELTDLRELIVGEVR